MISRPSDVKDVDFPRRIADLARLENCTPTKVEAIVGIVRALLGDEVNRVPRQGGGNYIGVNIFRNGCIVNYAESVEYAGFDDVELTTRHFLRFENEHDAKLFHFVLSGLLMLGLTKWNASQVFGDETIEIPAASESHSEPLKNGPQFSVGESYSTHIVPDVPGFNYFQKAG